MLRFRILIYIQFSIIVSIVNACTPCTLVRLEIDPIETGRIDTFVGKTNLTEIRFINEKTEGSVEVFPEPPLTVISSKFNTSCNIVGGVWSRNSVYVSSNNQTLMVQEFSGSRNSLTLYDVGTCMKLGEIAVSDANWKVSGHEITVNTQVTANGMKCNYPKVYLLDESCHMLRSNR
jgi:hypothetical protein